MPIRLRLAVRFCVPVLSMFLAGCDTGEKFAPLCPAAQLIPELADVVRYAGPGPAHDVSDLVLQARIVAVDGACMPGKDKAVLPVTVKISIAMRRGPAMKGRDADVPVFLAVTEGTVIRDKKVFAVHLTFPPNVEQLTIVSPEIDLDLPVSSKKSGAAYAIIAGFQLSEAERAVNRQAAANR